MTSAQGRPVEVVEPVTQGGVAGGRKRAPLSSPSGEGQDQGLARRGDPYRGLARVLVCLHSSTS